MKNLFKFIILSAAASFTFLSCEKEDNNATVPSTRTVEIIAGTPTTKTHYDGDLQIKWDNTEVSMAFVQWTGSYYENYISTQTSVTSGTEASFVSQISTQFQKGWGLYPSASCVNQSTGYIPSLDGKSFQINVPSVQTPVLVKNAKGQDIISFDPKADLLISAPISKEETANKDQIMMKFNRPLALVELKITPKRADGVTGIVENIEKIVFSSINPLAGLATVDLTQSLSIDGENASYVITPVDPKQSHVELNLSDLGLTAEVDKTVSTQFMAFPGELNSFAITVQTNKNVYTKKYENKPLALKANTKLTLNLTLDPKTKIERKFESVSDASTLKPGDEVIFVDDGFVMGPEIVKDGKKYRSAIAYPGNNADLNLHDLSIFKIVVSGHSDQVRLQDMDNKNFLISNGDELINDDKNQDTNGTAWMMINANNDNKVWVSTDNLANLNGNAKVICYDENLKLFRVKEQTMEEMNTTMYCRKAFNPIGLK